MAKPDEVEMSCKKCGHMHWCTASEARSFTIKCGVCDEIMRKTGRKKIEGDIVTPEPEEVIPTMIPRNEIIDKPSGEV
jgi:ribosomal protein S27E